MLSLKVRLSRKHAQDLSFSPFYPNKLACASGQYYGIAGSGSLDIITLPDVPGAPTGALAGAPTGVQGAQPVVQSLPWSDCLFSVAWSEKNEHVIVTGSGDGSIQVYDINNNKGPVAALKGHTREVSCVHWCQCRLVNHLFMSASWDSCIKIWNGETLQMVSDLPNRHDSLIYEVQSSPLVHGLFGSCSGDGMVKLWNMNSAHQPMGGWVAHPQAEVLSLDWCKYNQVCK
ncbi:PEX7 [Bugula neritina]|uniref:Peroxin-7 n=1 Tax=Bugula neritina TaxID=10212 RepID=A0A7J7JZX3_BUGNE|nr:PEX7 [Bugula neritina]